MEKTYMTHWGSRYVRSSSGKWYSVHGREGTWVTNRYGTSFYRSGSEVWRDITLADRESLERELLKRTRNDFKENKLKYNHWGKVVLTIARQSEDEKNEHTAELAVMLEALRQTFYGQKVQQLSTILDEIAVKD
ncbi:hypothetical protein pEaSNUABM28_00277 [Erwinia phage pEa_SNUABM_28]|uniref:Uncharacterized protein n=1 Tax=Erwinia phage pEa_SNUABM_16 TaxID=2869544 RepID=A0AAE8XR21_9CAUD|nr:hypothetical protein MPK64_gp275 [Erwinia phage pEa_SNUABM_16]QZE58834.1 hypothetical protein pEaSNUABM28_00277 [Erwinia phage pEa_SNUABM_28]QZE59178.1 hypothetical protein pEaSNUABM18_00275 [Erwinia phage pEa_SNUABM_18]UAW96419.1 hypothetical protein pEaSNUABM16_00275 [Erwinia phage pEa_SNUABM_16]